MRSSSLHWEQYSFQRDKLIINLRTKLLSSMSTLVGHAETSDLLLVAADGKKLPAHICILRQRAPIFFEKHISPTLDARTPRQRRSGEPLEVAIGDVDSAGLTFFIKSVYTDDEIQNLENEKTAKENSASSSDKREDDPDSFNFNDHTDYENNGQHYANQDGDEEDGEGETPRQDRDSFDRTPGAYRDEEGQHEEEVIYSVPLPREHDSGFHQSSSAEKQATTTTSVVTTASIDEPIMTSFRELANDSPMCLSGYSERSQYDIVEEEDEHEHEEISASNNYDSHGRLLLEDSGIVSSSQTESPKKKRSTKIFPMFIGFGGESSEMTQSMPSSTLSSSPYSSTNTLSAGSIRGRAMLARRLSVTSLTSLTSIDLTPTTENVTPIGDKLPCSQLGGDLLEMYQKSLDTDTVIVTDGGDLHAHKCILWATCPTFRKILKTSTKIELRGFSRNAIDFLLSFLYGGLTSIPEEVEVWEVIALATHLNIEELAQVAALHLKAHKCHFFHRPCATCVSAVFDALPQFRSIKCLNSLFDEAMSWQAKHFSRIWKGRVFLHLDEQWQHECRDALINEIDEEVLIDTLLGCEKLQASLSRTKSQQLAESVLTLVNDIIEYCTEFLISSFDLILGSNAFKSHGKGLALNLALLEDIFPPLIHSLSADTAIRAFITLRDLLIEIQQDEEDSQQQQQQSSPKRSFMNIPIHDWNTRFVHLCRRLFESIDKHLLHYAFSVVKSEVYSLLSEEEKSRIEESGIFVEMKMPRAPPPKLSSFNRTYKRSSSVGIPTLGRQDRTRSLERSRPIISQVIEASEKEEMAREKSFIEIHRRANSMKNPDSKRQSSSIKTIKQEIKEESPQHHQQPQQLQPQKQLPPTSTNSNPKTEKIKSRDPSPASASRIPAPTATVPLPVKRERSVSPTASTTQKQKPPESPSQPQLQQPQQPQQRTPKRTVAGPPPVKRIQKIINPEELMLERENTKILITKEQHKELGVDPNEIGIPQVTESPKIKPKSVVRPMPKNPSLAASTPAASILPPQPPHTAPSQQQQHHPSTQSSTKKELFSRTKSNSVKTGTVSSTNSSTSTTTVATSQRQRPRSALPTRQTAASAAKSAAAAAASIDRSKRVETKIPKVRA